MEYPKLIDMIECLTYNRKLNICIDFFDDYGNSMTALPHSNGIHGKPYCTYMKSLDGGFEKCFECRTAAIAKAKGGKVPFGGLCANGVYEYCHPVVERDTVMAVIMIGNIRRSDSTLCEPPEMSRFQDSFEEDFPEEMCKRMCSILDAHIKLLIKNFSKKTSDHNPLVHNIQCYIEEFLYSDITVSKIAEAFSYSEKYIGRLFKATLGTSLREYINEGRLMRAGMLLSETNKSVTEIASQVGFESLSYFNRMFRRKYGKSPTSFRKAK